MTTPRSHIQQLKYIWNSEYSWWIRQTTTPGPDYSEAPDRRLRDWAYDLTSLFEKRTGLKVLHQVTRAFLKLTTCHIEKPGTQWPFETIFRKCFAVEKNVHNHSFLFVCQIALVWVHGWVIITEYSYCVYIIWKYIILLFFIVHRGSAISRADKKWWEWRVASCHSSKSSRHTQVPCDSSKWGSCLAVCNCRKFKVIAGHHPN